MPGLWLVLPTYCEAENLEPFVRAVLPRMEAVSDAPRVLVVDDSSPDGTGRLADELAAADPRVEVLHNGAKRGLGRAYLAGFRRALAAGADLVVQMDADFSHDPAELPRLVAATANGGLVVGSRYVAGGGIAAWGRSRRLLSQAGSLYARRVLGVGVRDLTGGFKCWRAEVLADVLTADVRANGYVFQVEMTYRALRRGHSVIEVPIVFRDRERGASKMTASVAVEALWNVPAVRASVRADRRLRPVRCER